MGSARWIRSSAVRLVLMTSRSVLCRPSLRRLARAGPYSRRLVRGETAVGRDDRARGVRRGVQSGVQIERNRAQLRATQTALERRGTLDTPRTLRLGAGRSQVQILSPRSQKIPAKSHILPFGCGTGTGTKRGPISTGLHVAQAQNLALPSAVPTGLPFVVHGQPSLAQSPIRG